MARYVLSDHAKVVIAERAIQAQWLDRVLANPARTEADKRDVHLTYALARIAEHGDRVLRVVYNGLTSPVTVVTAYFDRTHRKKL